MEEFIKGDKNPMLALTLNCCLSIVGGGYLYLGQWQKALAYVLISIFVLAPLLVATAGLSFILNISLHPIIIIDAYMQAKALREGKRIGHWTFFSDAK